MNDHPLLRETPEAYYWMGFITADGTVQHYNRTENWALAIDLQRRDSAQLKLLSGYCTPYSSCYIINSRYTHYRARITGGNLIDEICHKFDLKPRKTYNPPVIDFNSMSDELFLSYLVGLIDGDGNIAPERETVMPSIRIKLHHSWAEYLTAIDLRLSGLTGAIPYGVKTNKHGYAIVNWGNWRTIRFLKIFTESAKLPVLNRKWEVINSGMEIKTRGNGDVERMVSGLLADGFSLQEIVKMDKTNPNSTRTIGYKLQRIA